MRAERPARARRDDPRSPRPRPESSPPSRTAGRPAPGPRPRRATQGRRRQAERSPGNPATARSSRARVAAIQIRDMRDRNDQEAVREGFRAPPDRDDRFRGAPVERENGHDRRDDERQRDSPGGRLVHRQDPPESSGRSSGFGLESSSTLFNSPPACSGRRWPGLAPTARGIARLAFEQLVEQRVARRPRVIAQDARASERRPSDPPVRGSISTSTFARIPRASEATSSSTPRVAQTGQRQSAASRRPPSPSPSPRGPCSGFRAPRAAAPRPRAHAARYGRTSATRPVTTTAGSLGQRLDRRVGIHADDVEPRRWHRVARSPAARRARTRTPRRHSANNPSLR